MSHERRTVHFSGNVQGVGFRYTTQRIARRHDVAGYVQNLPDGRVRLVAEGDEPALEGLIDEVRRAMDRYIAGEQIDRDEATGEFDGFGVRY